MPYVEPRGRKTRKAYAQAAKQGHSGQVTVIMGVASYYDEKSNKTVQWNVNKRVNNQ